MAKKLKDRKWFQTLMGIAPTVATALGGPFAGLAMNVIKGATGLDSEDAIEKALSIGDPATYKALQDANHAFELEMERMGIEKDRLVYEDKASARQMRMDTKDWTPTVLAVIAMGFFAWLVATVLGDLEIVEKNGEFIYYLLGFGTALVKQCFDFFLGSSIGSKAKDKFVAWRDK